MPFENNYTLGRGEVYFARLDPATNTLGGERYIGNTPEFNLTAEEEKLEHFSSDRGVRVKDATVTLQVNYTGTITCDNINHKNVALFFLGDTDRLTVAQTTFTAQPINNVEEGMFYQLGMTNSNPSGARNVIFPGSGGTLFTLFKVATPTNIALVHGTDYVLNAALGRIEILEGAPNVVNGDDLIVTYTVAASVRDRIISGSTAIRGALRYIATNPRGELIDYYMPSVTLSPNGDFPLKSDEWQQIPFNVDVTKRDDDTEALYGDNRPM